MHQPLVQQLRSTAPDLMFAVAQGLAAIAALLQASGSKWWHGARLQALEISDDRGQRGCTAAPHAAAVLAAGSGVHCSAFIERNTTQAQTAALRPATAPPMQASTCHQPQPCLARPCTGKQEKGVVRNSTTTGLWGGVCSAAAANPAMFNLGMAFQQY